MKAHAVTAHDIGDVDLARALPESEQGAEPEHALRLIVADAEGCKSHTEELLLRVSRNHGSATLLVGMALSRVYREFGFVGVVVVRARLREAIPQFGVIFDNIVDANESHDSPSMVLRNTIGAMAPTLRRKVVAGGVALLNLPSLDHLILK